MHIGIIGTAGRKMDINKLSKSIYYKITRHARNLISGLTTDEIVLVSGGAAWVDHVSVSLFLSDFAQGLILYLPAMFKDGKYVEGDREMDPGSIANYYHGVFSKKMGANTLDGISKAIQKGAQIVVNDKGFHARNIQVANDVDVLLAYTFGEGKEPRADSGTFHTWKNCPATLKIHTCISNL